MVPGRTQAAEPQEAENRPHFRPPGPSQLVNAIKESRGPASMTPTGRRSPRGGAVGALPAAARPGLM